MNNYYFSFEFNRFFLKNNFFEPLFLLNNIRFNYISKRITLKKKKILDLGCGLGLLSEKLAIHGGLVSGIDKSDLLIRLAFKNAEINKLSINYICCDFLCIEKFDFKFDIIVCTEVLEHLDDIVNFFYFLDKISKKNTVIFISSLNKSLLSYFKIVFLGEFISGSLIKNTHKYEYFFNAFSLKINLEKYGFIINDIKYLNYNGLFRYAFLQSDYDVNYVVELVKTK